MNPRETRILFTILNLKLPDDVRDALVTGATAKGLDVEKLVEAYRTVYALGFYDGAVYTLDQEGVDNER